jgi:hypothetical protein
MRAVVSLFLAVALLAAQADIILPQVISVDPDSGPAGTVVKASGSYLEKARVAKVFLTDGSRGYEVKVAEQQEKSFKFTVPADLRTGRYSLMVQTTNYNQQLVEQPVKFAVEAEPASNAKK